MIQLRRNYEMFSGYKRKVRNRRTTFLNFQFRKLEKTGFRVYSTQFKEGVEAIQVDHTRFGRAG